jgi:hypothetical protein
MNKAAKAVALEVYELSKKFSAEKKYSLTDLEKRTLTLSGLRMSILSQ